MFFSRIKYVSLLSFSVCMLGSCARAPRTIPVSAAMPTAQHFTLDTNPVIGLSALTQDTSGHLWAVSERNRVLLSLDLSASNPKVLQTVALEGIPDGTDTEALAYIGGGVFVLGTETHTENRTSDTVYFARIENNTAEVYDAVSLPYDLWSLKADKNRGIEGLCYAEGHMVLASETVGLDTAKRFAPIARYDSTQDSFVPYRLWLTTQEGKISALACGSLLHRDTLEVFAIERHYKESRLLRFLIPLYTDRADIIPEVVADLHAVVGDPLPNFEGVVRTADGGFILLSDSSNGGKVTATHVLRLQKP